MEKEKHREFLEEQLERITELPHDMLVLVLKRIKKEAKEIMKSIAQLKVKLPQNYEKKASAILECQKLISSADNINLQAVDFPEVEIERAGDKNMTAKQDNTKRTKKLPKQPVHQSIFSLLDEDEERSQDSEDLQPKTTNSALPTLLLANETSGHNRNLCFVNSPVQLLRQIPTFRCVC